MKKLYFVLAFIISTIVANHVGGVAVQEFITAQNGKLSQAGVLADSGGNIFLEVPDNLLIVGSENQQRYTGSLVAPIIVDVPSGAPRPLLREVLSFEFSTDDNTEVRFTTQYDVLPYQERLRWSIHHSLEEAPNTRFRGAEPVSQSNLIKLLLPIPEASQVRQPVLWYYDQVSESWQRQGGQLKDTPEPETKLLTASLKQTGIYTIWDESPLPEAAPLLGSEAVDLVEQAPVFDEENSEDPVTIEVGEQAVLETLESELFSLPPQAPFTRVEDSSAEQEPTIIEFDATGLVPALEPLKTFDTDVVPTQDVFTTQEIPALNADGSVAVVENPINTEKSAVLVSSALEAEAQGSPIETLKPSAPPELPQTGAIWSWGVLFVLLGTGSLIWFSFRKKPELF